MAIDRDIARSFLPQSGGGGGKSNSSPSNFVNPVTGNRVTFTGPQPQLPGIQSQFADAYSQMVNQRQGMFGSNNVSESPLASKWSNHRSVDEYKGEKRKLEGNEARVAMAADAAQNKLNNLFGFNEAWQGVKDATAEAGGWKTPEGLAAGASELIHHPSTAAKFVGGLGGQMLGGPVIAAQEIAEIATGNKYRDIDERGYIPTEKVTGGQKVAEAMDAVINTVGMEGAMLGGIKTGGKKLIGKMASSALMEGAEEAGQSLLENKRNLGQEGDGEYFSEGWQGRMAESFGLGAVGGAVMGGAGHILSGSSDQKVRKVGSNPEISPDNSNTWNSDDLKEDQWVRGVGEGIDNTYALSKNWDEGSASVLLSPGAWHAANQRSAEKFGIDDCVMSAETVAAMAKGKDVGSNNSAKIVAKAFGIDPLDQPRFRDFMQIVVYADMANQDQKETAEKYLNDLILQKEMDGGNGVSLTVGKNPQTNPAGRVTMQLRGVQGDGMVFSANPLIGKAFNWDFDGDTAYLSFNSKLRTNGWASSAMVDKYTDKRNLDDNIAYTGIDPRKHKLNDALRNLSDDIKSHIDTLQEASDAVDALDNEIKAKKSGFDSVYQALNAVAKAQAADRVVAAARAENDNRSVDDILADQKYAKRLSVETRKALNGLIAEEQEQTIETMMSWDKAEEAFEDSDKWWKEYFEAVFPEAARERFNTTIKPKDYPRAVHLWRFMTGEINFTNAHTRDNWSFRGGMAKMLKTLKPITESDDFFRVVLANPYDFMMAMRAKANWNTGKPEKTIKTVFNRTVMLESLAEAQSQDIAYNEGPEGPIFTSFDKYEKFRNIFKEVYNKNVSRYEEAIKVDTIEENSSKEKYGVNAPARIDSKDSIDDAFCKVFGDRVLDDIIKVTDESFNETRSLNTILKMRAEGKDLLKRISPSDRAANMFLNELDGVVGRERGRLKRLIDDAIGTDASGGLLQLSKYLNRNRDDLIGRRAFYEALVDLVGAKTAFLGEFGNLDTNSRYWKMMTSGNKETLKNMLVSALWKGKYQQIINTVLEFNEAKDRQTKDTLKWEIVSMTEQARNISQLDEMLCDEIQAAVETGHVNVSRLSVTELASTERTFKEKIEIADSLVIGEKGEAMFLNESFLTMEADGIQDKMTLITKNKYIIEEANKSSREACREDWSKVLDLTNGYSDNVTNLYTFLKNVTATYNYEANMGIVANALYGQFDLTNDAIEKGKAYESMQAFYYQTEVMTGGRPMSWIDGTLTFTDKPTIDINTFWAHPGFFKEVFFGRAEYRVTSFDKPGGVIMNQQALWRELLGDESFKFSEDTAPLAMATIFDKRPELVRYLCPTSLHVSDGASITVNETPSMTLSDACSKYSNNLARAGVEGQDLTKTVLKNHLMTEMMKDGYLLTWAASITNLSNKSISREAFCKQLDENINTALDEMISILVSREDISEIIGRSKYRAIEKIGESIKKRSAEASSQIHVFASDNVDDLFNIGNFWGAYNKRATDNMWTIIDSYSVQESFRNHPEEHEDLTEDQRNHIVDVFTKLHNACDAPTRPQEMMAETEDELYGIVQAQGKAIKAEYVANYLFPTERSEIKSTTQFEELLSDLPAVEREAVLAYLRSREDTVKMFTDKMRFVGQMLAEELGLIPMPFGEQYTGSTEQKKKIRAAVRKSGDTELWNKFQNDIKGLRAKDNEKKQELFREFWMNVNGKYVEQLIRDTNAYSGSFNSTAVLQQMNTMLKNVGTAMDGLRARATDENDPLYQLVKDYRRQERTEDKRTSFSAPIGVIDLSGSALATLNQVNLNASSVTTRAGIEGGMQEKSATMSLLRQELDGAELRTRVGTKFDVTGNVEMFEKTLNMIRIVVATGMEGRLLKFKKKFNSGTSHAIPDRAGTVDALRSFLENRYDGGAYINLATNDAELANLANTFNEYLEAGAAQVNEELSTDQTGLGGTFDMDVIKNYVLLHSPVVNVEIEHKGERITVVVPVSVIDDTNTDGTCGLQTYLQDEYGVLVQVRGVSIAPKTMTEIDNHLVREGVAKYYSNAEKIALKDEKQKEYYEHLYGSFWAAYTDWSSDQQRIFDKESQTFVENEDALTMTDVLDASKNLSLRKFSEEETDTSPTTMQRWFSDQDRFARINKFSASYIRKKNARMKSVEKEVNFESLKDECEKAFAKLITDKDLLVSCILGKTAEKTVYGRLVNDSFKSSRVNKNRTTLVSKDHRDDISTVVSDRDHTTEKGIEQAVEDLEFCISTGQNLIVSNEMFGELLKTPIGRAWKIIEASDKAKNCVIIKVPKLTDPIHYAGTFFTCTTQEKAARSKLIMHMPQKYMRGDSGIICLTDEGRHVYDEGHIDINLSNILKGTGFDSQNTTRPVLMTVENAKDELEVLRQRFAAIQNERARQAEYKSGKHVPIFGDKDGTAAAYINFGAENKTGLEMFNSFSRYLDNELDRPLNDNSPRIVTNCSTIGIIKQVVKGQIVYTPIYADNLPPKFRLTGPTTKDGILKYHYTGSRLIGTKDAYKIVIPGFPMKDISVGREAMFYIDKDGNKKSYRTPVVANTEGKVTADYLADSEIMDKRNDGREPVYTFRQNIYNWSRDHAYNVLYSVGADGTASLRKDLSEKIVSRGKLTKFGKALEDGDRSAWEDIAYGKETLYKKRYFDQNELMRKAAWMVSQTKGDYRTIFCPGQNTESGEFVMTQFSNYDWEALFSENYFSYDEFLGLFNLMNERFCVKNMQNEGSDLAMWNSAGMIKCERGWEKDTGANQSKDGTWVRADYVNPLLVNPTKGTIHGYGIKFSDQMVGDAMITGAANLDMHRRFIEIAAVRSGRADVSYRGVDRKRFRGYYSRNDFSSDSSLFSEEYTKLMRKDYEDRIGAMDQGTSWSKNRYARFSIRKMVYETLATEARNWSRMPKIIDEQNENNPVTQEDFDSWFEQLADAFGFSRVDDEFALFTKDLFNDIVIHGKLGWTWIDGTDNTITKKMVNNAVSALSSEIASFRGGRISWFLQATKPVNGRYCIPMLPKDTVRLIANITGKNYEDLMRAQLQEQKIQEKNFDLITDIAKHRALHNASDFLRDHNGYAIDADRFFGRIGKAEMNVVNNRMAEYLFGSDTGEERQRWNDNARRSEEASRQINQMTESERYKTIEIQSAPGTETLISTRHDQGTAIKVARIYCNIARAMSLINPFLPVAANIDKAWRAGLTSAEMHLTMSGIIPFYSGAKNINVSDNFFQIVKTAAADRRVQLLIKAFNELSLNGDDLAAVANARTEQDLMNVLNNVAKNKDFSDKLYSTAAMWSSGLNTFSRTQAERFFQSLALKLNYDNSPAWFRVMDESGETLFEKRLKEDPVGVMIQVLLDPADNPDWLAGQQALNYSKISDMGQKNLISIIYQHLARKYPGVDVAAVLTGNKFIQYKTNQLGRILNCIAPMSSIHHLATKWVINNGEVLAAETNGAIDAGISGEAAAILFHDDLKSAIIYDVMHMGLFLTAVCLAGSMFFEPPDDDDKWNQPSEWLIGGMRVDTAWWLQDTLGIAIPAAAWMKSCLLGKPQMDLLTNGIAEFAYFSPMTDAADFVDLVLSPDTELSETSDLVGDWSDMDGGQPSFGQVVATKAKIMGLTGLANIICPSFLKELYQAAPEYNASYKNIWEEDRTGAITEDGMNGKTMKTTYDDAQLRKLAKKNPAVAILLNLWMRPNTSYWATKMPEVQIYEPVMMSSLEEHTLVEEDGTYKANKDQIIGEIIGTLQSTSDMASLWEQGYYIPYDTKEYISKLVYAHIDEVQDAYYEAEANGEFSWKTAGNGDYDKGMAIVSKRKAAYWDEINYWKDFYYNKLWSDDLNKPIQSYRQYNTTYLRDKNGNYYATGFKRSDLSWLPIQFAPGTIEEKEGTAGYKDDFASISAVNGRPLYDENQNGIRALVPNVEVYGTPSLESWADKNDDNDSSNGNGGSNNGNKYNANNDDDSSDNKKNKTGGYKKRSGKRGGGSGGGGGAGYPQKINHNKIYSTKMNGYNISDSTRIYDADLDYLRPSFATKGSRTAYRRNDL